jgi:hypothetical protein
MPRVQGDRALECSNSVDISPKRFQRPAQVVMVLSDLWRQPSGLRKARNGVCGSARV